MRLLLDTHALVWWMLDSARLSSVARDAMADPQNELWWSVASTWELAIMARLGKIELPAPLHRMLADALAKQAIAVLSIQQVHALRVHRLTEHHRDPFDRMLVAQALEERMTLLTRDTSLAAYAVDTLW